MFDYQHYVNKTAKTARMSNEQKNADIEAINDLFGQYGVFVTGGIESITTIQYRCKLSPSANIQKILKMRENLCIALADDSVRLYREAAELVIEKKGAANNIYLGDLNTEYFQNHTGLCLMLGISTKGEKIYTDLKKAPHMLIAGTTGSGKSVLENAIICSLLMKYPDIDIYGIDTKRVEFASFRSAPNFHYITDEGKATTELARLCEVMDDRYTQLSRARVSNIDEYNDNGGTMKPIVVVIDEFADLMLVSGKSVEQYIVRLAQKARACGIHLVIATQRPTRDVITGLIKANIPTKICLKVTSALDSRIVMDRNGGEELAGKGDMLFLGNGAFEPIRIQSCLVEEQEKINVAVIAQNIVMGTPLKKKEEEKSTKWNLFKRN